MKKLTLILISFVIISATLSAQNTIQKEILVYATKDGQKLFLDKYVDSRTQFTGKRPVMIYVHGGGFSTGSSKNALQIKYNKHFAAQGFVSISINYRLSIKADTPFDRGKLSQAAALATEDLIDATAFVISKAKEWNIDTEKIIISGGSAGAITCLNAEYAIISQGKFAEKLPEDFNYAGVISHAGNVIVQQDTLDWKKIPCPMLLMHGSADQLVTFNSSKIGNTLFAGSNYLHKQFEKMNAPHWLYEEVDADHIVALKPLQYNFWEIDSFIQRFVLNKSNAIIHTQWKDKKPDSMTEMAAVVPLYMSGWEKTDEEVEQAQKKN
ncbi:MAG TPA: carboxylesterase family protein [Chryseolinea sp.]|nr:carboxylesterase family protein [Chryseolinea sp.]